MKENERNGKSDPRDFLRYSKGEMTGRERNLFEKKLQKDPFSEDAAEGFSRISSENAEADMKKLEGRLKSRIAHRNRFLIYRIAASVAVLVIISSLFITLPRKDKSKEPAEMAATRETLDIPESRAVVRPSVTNAREMKATSGGKKLANNKISGEPQREKAETSEINEIVEEIKSETVAAAPVKSADQTFEKDNVLITQTAAGMGKSERMTVRGKIISSEDSMPVPGASVLVKGTSDGTVTDANGNFKITLPEEGSKTLVADFIGMKRKEFEAGDDTELQVRLEPDTVSLLGEVVIGYGTTRAAGSKNTPANESGAQETGYVPPQPVGGKSHFNRYIEENLRKPGSLPGGKKAVVVLGFKVRISGVPDSIRVIRSPGDEFSDEAKRLILEGPSWQPAVSNGSKREDEVRIRIVFK